MPLSEQQIILLFQKHLQGKISEEEMLLLQNEARKDSDIETMLYFLDLRITEPQSDLEAELIYEKTRPNSLSIDKEKYKSKKNKLLLFKPLIAVACLLVIISFAYLQVVRTKKIDSKIEWQTVKTEKGERKFFKLVDGTEVWLNNESIMKIKDGYGVVHRELSLIGEAYFSVAKNTKLQLSVQTEETIIKVLGTVFNVRAYPEDQYTETSLLEGKVNLEIPGESKTDYHLFPGDKVIVSRNNKKKKKKIAPAAINFQIEYKKMDLKNKNSIDFKWIDNKLVFNADPLPSMLTKLSRWYNRTIILKSETLNDELFTGVFDEKECEQVLEVLKKTGVNLKYEVNKDTIYIK